MASIKHALIPHSQGSGDALIARKRAEIEAKVAAMKKNALSVSAAVAPPPVKIPVSVPSPSPALTPTPRTGSPAAPGSPTVTDDLSRRVAEAKRRVAEAQSKLAVKDNPYMVRSLILPHTTSS